MKVTVSKDIMSRAQRANSSHCMIADAIRAQYPALLRISVDLATIRWSDPRRGERIVHFTPKRAQQAICDFDQGKEQPAFAFKLARKPAQIMEMNRSASKVRAPRRAVSTKSERDAGQVPTIVDGVALPTSASPGAQRKFGVKALKA